MSTTVRTSCPQHCRQGPRECRGSRGCILSPLQCCSFPRQSCPLHNPRLDVRQFSRRSRQHALIFKSTEKVLCSFIRSLTADSFPGPTNRKSLSNAPASSTLTSLRLSHASRSAAVAAGQSSPRTWQVAAIILSTRPRRILARSILTTV